MFCIIAMIPQVHWPDLYGVEVESPFQRGSDERQIRLTLHSESFVGAPEAEMEAIRMLLGLGHLKDVDLMTTEKGEHSHLTKITPDTVADNVTYEIAGEHKETITGTARFKDLQCVSMRLAGKSESNDPEVQGVLSDLLVAGAHQTLRRDILVTLSQRLMSSRSEWPLREANLHTPCDAAKLVGLFLRSRGNYVIETSKGGTISEHQGSFYWILVRNRLPSMWHYFSACVHAEPERKDNTCELGQAVLTRCVRATEARDAIGVQFFLPQDNQTRDTIIYHFDYLTLLLAGALDAQARVAHRAYVITKPPEYRAAFRNQDFRDALLSKGADDLHGLVTGDAFLDLMDLVYGLRNTIHGAGLTTLAYRDVSSPERSFIRVSPNDRSKIETAAGQRDSLDYWGLIPGRELYLEPYTFATALVNECLDTMDKVAATTDVSKLFPPGSSRLSKLNEAPAQDASFEYSRKRVALLG